MSSTLVDILGQGDPSAPALILGSGGPKFTRQQVHQAAVQLAHTLRSSGISPGDVVTIAEPNTVDNVVLFLGVTYARAVAAPLNQNYTKDEFEFYMEDSGSKYLITGPDGNPAAEAATATPILSVHLEAAASLDATPTLQIALLKGDLPLEVASGEESALKDPPLPSDEALFLHTSGTTSRPKGVPLSHANLIASIENIIATYQFTPDDVSLLVMPLFHVHGLMAGLLSPLCAGASVVIPAGGRFSAATFWADAVDNKVTFYTAVPTIHQILVSRSEKDYPKSNPPPLRFIRSCSSSLAPATLHKVEELFNAPVLEAYAMTEASHQMTSNPLPSVGPHKPGTVGKAQGSVQVTILGPGPEFAQLPPGEIGEVCIRGPNVTSGYRNNPKANEESYGGGWFHTGDQGLMDEEGYLQLTGRIKELINRGGEKISPLEVDACLLSHPDVAEAVSFAAPDEKYGEVVAAAVVLTDGGKEKLAKGEDLVASIKNHCAVKLSAFKTPTQVFITDELPKTATGKVQRRFMVDAFITGGKKEREDAEAGGKKAGDKTFAPPSSSESISYPADGFFLAARALYRLGVRYMFGVVGIPVTQLASAAQACGIRYIGFRNEQSAGYAAAAAGYITGVPGVLLTVSGPGVVHGLAGLSDAQINCWPMVMISGSCETKEVGKGAFQELDQVAAVSPYVKLARKASSLGDIPSAISDAFAAAVSGRPGAAYVDLPSDILMSHISGGPTEADSYITKLPEGPILQGKIPAEESDVASAVAMLRDAQRPLIVIGKGAAFGKAENALRKIIDGWDVPFLATSMGRGVLSDERRHCANAARSMALAQADVALIFGARLNWQLHFGETPKWSSGVKFILVDPEPSQRDAELAAVTLRGDAATVADQLLAALPPNSLTTQIAEWAATLSAKALSATMKLEGKLAATAFPLNYLTTMRVIRDEILNVTPQPVVVSEGANTMDNARLILSPVIDPRCRLDAGTWGTMGVGPGYAIAAAVTCPERGVVAVEGDSAFGFSGMEVETACRYDLPIVFIIINNGGVYGGDRRESQLQELATSGLKKAGYGKDPAPTAFVPGARYDMLATAFGGVGVRVNDAAGLQAALKEALQSRRPTVVDVEIDPMAGVESGNVHSFNAPKKD